jgi:hypothetical protein
MRGSSAACVPSAPSRLIAAAASAACSSTMASCSSSAPIAAIRCVPLSSARPSFASSRRGSNPAWASASAPETKGEGRRAKDSMPSSFVLCLSSGVRMAAEPSPISTCAMWASGARSPLAPTEPRDGTSGTTPWFSSASSASTTARRTPDAPRDRLAAVSSIIARTASGGSGAPTPAAWLRTRLC